MIKDLDGIFFNQRKPMEAESTFHNLCDIQMIVLLNLTLSLLLNIRGESDEGSEFGEDDMESSEEDSDE